MKIGLIGLGKMGRNLALNAGDHHHEVHGYDAMLSVREAARAQGIMVHESLAELLANLDERRVLWVMVPSGSPTEDVLMELASSLKPGDIVIDGGNTNYHRTMEHSDLLSRTGIKFLDVGTSGGKEGARYGACLMVGGDREAFAYLHALFVDISLEDGVLYCGPAGSGHYLKMVHNGIEYGMMQAIGEGFEILNSSEFTYDFAAVSKVWNHGSVIRGWLMELAQAAFTADENLADIRGIVDANGEGEWTVASALDLKVPAPVIALSVFMRYRSQQEDTFSGKVVAALRNEFGGHAITKK